MEPKYECQFDGEFWSPCTPEQFCGDNFKPNGTPYRIDFSQDESLDNWFNHLHLECEQFQTKGQYSISLFQISFFSGIILGMLMFPLIADKSGRKVVFFMGVALHLMLVLCTIIVNEAQWFYCLVFLMGIEQPARIIIGYIYLSEFCTESGRQRALVTSIANFLVAQSATLCVIYFTMVSKHWIYFEMAGGVGLSVLSLTGMCWIPESPRWLIAQGRYTKALKVYKRIAKINGKTFSNMVF